MNRRQPEVRLGIDRARSQRFAMLRGMRVGAIVNPTSVDRNLDHLADLLCCAEGVTPVALFGPEHGVRGSAQDMIGVASSVDARTGIPVKSLYGSSVQSLAPRDEDLEAIDVLVFDIQDVGSRYYTFAATMKYAMVSAARLGIQFVVFDRPNPIGGVKVEGPTVEPGFESFVGAHPLPIRHGLTIGELALLFKRDLALELDLTVVPCEGWRRSMLWEETGLPWVSPSPNMPSPMTSLVYPGGCLLEGTNLSEGRGTTRPFELWGAPWIDGSSLAEQANALKLPGVRFRACAFQPMFHKHAGEICAGVQPHVTDLETFEPAATYAVLIALARTQAPERFAWRSEPYEFVADPIAIDLLFGSSRERKAIESGGDLQEVFEKWRKNQELFLTNRKDALLYE